MSSPALAGQHVQTLLEYGAQCAQEVGEIPPFDCNSGTEIPITINGKRQGANEAPNQCDKPSLLHLRDGNWPGQCLPGSRVLNLSRGSTQISAYCRRDRSHPGTKPVYDEVDIVLHHSGNGKTCWFASRPPSDPATGIDTSRVPPPNEKMPPSGFTPAVEFWKSPVDTASMKCMSCHDAGPFIFSPYIGQVWDKVPTDPWGKYSSIGQAFPHDPVMVITTPGNACIGCHRIGRSESCELYIPLSVGQHLEKSPGNNEWANTYPASHWMPPGNNMSESEWSAANMKSVDSILSCCKGKKGADRDCTFTPISTNETQTNKPAR